MRTQKIAYTTNVLLAVMASVLTASIVLASEVQPDQTQATTKLPAAAQVPMSEADLARVGEELVFKVCATGCHGMDEIEEMRRTRAGWIELVRTMKLKGAVATEPQFETIRQYLPRYYGLVAVNTATAEELSAVMGFTARDAQAIVGFRTANGKFADVNALKKVPRIDVTKIDEQPNALRFN
jgi:competence ComEA-like helix-hairpin-helix protein